MKQPYTLKDIDENEFNSKVEIMLHAINDVKDIIVCDLSDDSDCVDTCPLKPICKDLSKVQMWAMLRRVLPE